MNSSTSCGHPPPGAGIAGASHHAAMPGTQLFVCHLIGALCPFSELGVGVQTKCRRGESSKRSSGLCFVAIARLGGAVLGTHAYLSQGLFRYGILRELCGKRHPGLERGSPVKRGGWGHRASVVTGQQH